MEAPLQHVFFTAVDHLDRHAGHLFGDRDGLAHIVGHAAPAKTTTQVDFVNIALGLRQSGHLGRGGQRRFAVLGGGPNFAALGRPARGGVHGFHARVVLVRVAVNGLDLFGGTGHRGLDVAILVAHGGLGRIERGAHDLGKFGAGLFGVLAVVPLNRQGFQCGFGAPPGVGNHGHSVVAHTHHFFHAGFAGNRCRVKRFELAAKHRALFDGGVQHAGHLQIHAENLFAGGFVHRVEPGQALAGQLPVFGVFQSHFGEIGGSQFARGGGDFAVAHAAPCGGVGHHAVGRAAFGRRHLPIVGGGLYQHHSGGCAAFAHVVVGLADALAAAGAKVAPYAVTRQVLRGGGVFGAHFGPIGIEFFGYQLRQSRQRALAHFRARDADDYTVVRVYHHPGVDFIGVGLGAGFAAKRDVKGESEPCSASGGGRGAQKTAARYARGDACRGSCIHGVLLR